MSPIKKSEQLKRRIQSEGLEAKVPPTTSRPRRARPSSMPTVNLVVDKPTVVAPPLETGPPQTAVEMEQLILDRLTIAMEM